ncbi:hypothetical protein AALD22_03515 [Lachnospiraceae bacterium 56-18]|jgi:hypothetical protein
MPLKKNINMLILVVLEVLLLYAPEFVFLPYYTWALAALGLIIVILKSRFARQYGILSNTTYAVFAMLFFNIVWSFLVTGLNGTSDYSYITFLVGTLLTVCRVFLLVFFVNKSITDCETATNIYLESLAYAGAIYVTFTLIFIIAPQFKQFWLTNVVHSIERDYFAYQFRYSLNGFAAFASSTISSLIVIISSYLLVKNAIQGKWKKYFFLYIINIIGCFFYGRICIFAILLSLIYILGKLGNKPQIFKIAFTALIIIIALLTLVDYLSTVNESFQYWRDWSFAIIDQLFSNNGITDYSVTHMKEDMFFMPEIKTLLIGDGKYTLESGSYYMHTDVGIMRGVLFFGILGNFVNYLMVYYVAKKTCGKTDDKKLITMVLFVCVMVIILELKGEAYQRGLQILLPIFYTSSYDLRRTIIVKD